MHSRSFLNIYKFFSRMAAGNASYKMLSISEHFPFSHSSILILTDKSAYFSLNSWKQF